MFELTDERLKYLTYKIWLFDIEQGRELGIANLSLELNKTGYPRLGFFQYDFIFSLKAGIPSTRYPGNDTDRELTIEEMVTFVRVAKKKFPDARMTKELIKFVTSYLTEKQNEINLALELIS